MKIHRFELQYEELLLDQLQPEIQRLFTLAEEQLDHSYAPYSDFNVGSALLLKNGEISVGCNQENASYPLCMCGERVALYNAGANYPGVIIKSLVISCRNNKKQLDTPVSPCGACRQVIHEFSVKQDAMFPIYLKVHGRDTIYKFGSIEDLLPFSFGAEYLL